MSKNHTTSNLTAKEALDRLLKKGFKVVANGNNPRPTARKDARHSRGFSQTPNATTSKSGRSIFLKGVHVETGEHVDIHLQTSGRLTVPARQALAQKTGLDL